MKLPSSAIALTLMLGTILVNAPMQPVTAGHSPTEDKQSFDNKPERVTKAQVCRVKPCEYPIRLALPQPEMGGNEPNEPLPFINNFHTTLEPLKKEASQLKYTVDSFVKSVEKNLKTQVPYFPYLPTLGPNPFVFLRPL